MTEFADILIHNARVTTKERGAPEATWIALGGGRIQALGLGCSRNRIGPVTRVIDAEGATLLPGLNDVHLHLFQGGMALSELSLFGLRGREVLRRAIADFRARHPDLGFLAASNCDYQILEDAPLGREVLDEFCPDVPLMITSVDYHTAWANTAALEGAGLMHGADTGSGSSVMLDDNGVATGELREFAAIDLLRRTSPTATRHSLAARHPLVSPTTTPAEREADKRVLRQALRHCAEQGLTSVHNMDGSLYQLELLAEMDRDEGLPVRVRMPFQLIEGMTPADLTHAVQWRAQYASDMLRCDFIKIFADGVMESGTANLLSDYLGRPGESGAPLFSDADLTALVTEADLLGFQIAFHCVGDAAVRQVLDACEAARNTNGWRAARHRIEHIEMLDPSDAARFARIGVVASMQPTHIPEAGEAYLELIGTERCHHAFPVNDLRDAGAEVIFSTDWPVAPLSPFITLEAALARAPWPGSDRDHRVSLPMALDAITRDAAWLAFDEERRGRLMPGMMADVTLLDCDITTAEPSRVAARLTICNGRITHNQSSRYEEVA